MRKDVPAPNGLDREISTETQEIGAQGNEAVREQKHDEEQGDEVRVIQPAAGITARAGGELTPIMPQQGCKEDMWPNLHLQSHLNSHPQGRQLLSYQ